MMNLAISIEAAHETAQRHRRDNFLCFRQYEPAVTSPD
jgi:hypothetical protein